MSIVAALTRLSLLCIRCLWVSKDAWGSKSLLFSPEERTLAALTTKLKFYAREIYGHIARIMDRVVCNKYDPFVIGEDIMIAYEFRPVAAIKHVKDFKLDERYSGTSDC
jgi:hypothetical protein